jgi:hypothetical protein
VIDENPENRMLAALVSTIVDLNLDSFIDAQPRVLSVEVNFISVALTVLDSTPVFNSTEGPALHARSEIDCIACSSVLQRHPLMQITIGLEHPPLLNRNALFFVNMNLSAVES